MAQSLSKIFVHLIFSTKDRRQSIPQDYLQELCGYLVGILRNLDSPSLAVNAVPDHVHVLFRLSRSHALAKVIEEVKKGSSKWMKTKGPVLEDFCWQAGYGAFSVSQSCVEQVMRYIKQQPRHHETRTFQEEFIELLDRHGVEYDERYVWT